MRLQLSVRIVAGVLSRLVGIFAAYVAQFVSIHRADATRAGTATPTFARAPYVHLPDTALHDRDLNRHSIAGEGYTSEVTCTIFISSRGCDGHV